MADLMFQNEILKWHNYYRDRHNTPPLRYNVNIGQLAQRWANELASTGQFTQSDPHTRVYNNQQLGENCAMKWTSTNEDFSGSEVVEQWCADEEASFNFNDPDGQTAGHFSQVVWRGSTDVGVGKAQGPDGKWIVVANYFPAGNVIGRFRDNVLPPTSSVGPPRRNKKLTNGYVRGDARPPKAGLFYDLLWYIDKGWTDCMTNTYHFVRGINFLIWHNIRKLKKGCNRYMRSAYDLAEQYFLTRRIADKRRQGKMQIGQGPSPPMQLPPMPPMPPARPFSPGGQVGGPPMYAGQMQDQFYGQMQRRRPMDDCFEDDFFARDSNDKFLQDSNYQMGGNQMVSQFAPATHWQQQQQQDMQTSPNKTVTTRTETVNGVTKTMTTERTLGPNGRRTVVTRESTRS